MRRTVGGDGIGGAEAGGRGAGGSGAGGSPSIGTVGGRRGRIALHLIDRLVQLELLRRVDHEARAGLSDSDDVPLGNPLGDAPPDPPIAEVGPVPAPRIFDPPMPPPPERQAGVVGGGHLPSLAGDEQLTSGRSTQSHSGQLELAGVSTPTVTHQQVGHLGTPPPVVRTAHSSLSLVGWPWYGGFLRNAPTAPRPQSVAWGD